MSYNEENIYDFEQEHDHEHEHEMPTSDKYTEALNKYNTALKDDEVAYTTENILNKYLHENNTKDVKKFLLNSVDLTSLKCTDSEESILKLTEKVNEFADKYPDMKNVAAI